MAWYNASWQFRKKLTVPAANVAGAGALTARLFFRPADDADIAVDARFDGRDILFTEADGTTKIPHELLPEKQFASRDAVWSWFGGPHAVYHNGVNERLFVAVATRFGTGLQRVVQYDYGTEAITETDVGSEAHVDDHQNPGLLVRSSDSKLMVFYPLFHSFDLIGFKVSTNAEDATAWGSETTLDPNGTGAYAYPSPIELTTEGLIYLFYRQGTGNAWWYITTDDDGATWAAAVELFSDSGFGTNPYVLRCSNGTTRIDFLVSSDDGNSPGDPNKIYHFYYDGTWRNSVGTDIGTPPFDGADFTTVYDGTSSNPVWIGDITYDSSNRPHVLFYVYPAAADTNQDLYEGEFDGSTWTTRKVCDEGGGIAPASRSIYHGASVLDPDDDTVAWVAKQETVYEIQKWRKTSGTWAKEDDVTTGSAYNHFRPTIAKGAPAGKKGRLLFLSPFDYPDLDSYKSAVTAYPALGSHFAMAYILADVDGTTDTDIFCYYGHPTAADQQNRAGVWSDYLRVYHTEERYGGSASWLEDASGNGDPVNGTAGSDPYRAAGDSTSDVGNAITFNGSQFVVVDDPPNFANFSGFCAEAWAKSTVNSTQAIISTGFSTSQADIAMWLDSTPGFQVHNVILDNSYKFAAPLSGITPVANTWAWFALLWSAAGGLQGRMNQTETTVASSTGTTLDDGATGSVAIGATPAPSNHLNGALAEIRISNNVYRTKDYTDTQWDNWDLGNAFFTIGAEEEDGGGGIVAQMLQHGLFVGGAA